MPSIVGRRACSSKRAASGRGTVRCGAVLERFGAVQCDRRGSPQGTASLVRAEVSRTVTCLRVVGTGREYSRRTAPRTTRPSLIHAAVPTGTGGRGVAPRLPRGSSDGHCGDPRLSGLSTFGPARLGQPLEVFNMTQVALDTSPGWAPGSRTAVLRPTDRHVCSCAMPWHSVCQKHFTCCSCGAARPH